MYSAYSSVRIYRKQMYGLNGKNITYYTILMYEARNA